MMINSSRSSVSDCGKLSVLFTCCCYPMMRYCIILRLNAMPSVGV